MVDAGPEPTNEEKNESTPTVTCSVMLFDQRFCYLNDQSHRLSTEQKLKYLSATGCCICLSGSTACHCLLALVKILFFRLWSCGISIDGNN